MRPERPKKNDKPACDYGQNIETKGLGSGW